ncbi:MAG: hypothetical protein ACLTYW_07480 [Collinsella sp.]
MAGQPARSGIDFSAFRDSKLARELIDASMNLSATAPSTLWKSAARIP